MEGELFSGVSAQGMVDRLCELAVERKASDVHAEPLAEGGRIRLRRRWGEWKIWGTSAVADFRRLLTVSR